MADFKDERAYDSRTLTRWFLWSSLGLLVCVAWMAWHDYHRSWKGYQRRFMALERTRDHEKLGEARAGIDVARYKQLKSRLKEAEGELKSHGKEINALEEKEARLDARLYQTRQLDYQVLKARISADSYKYGAELREGKADPGLQKRIGEETGRADALNDRIFSLQRERDQAAKDLKAIYARRDALRDEIQKMTGDYLALRKRIQGLSFNFLFYFRNAILLDFLAPTLRIHQVVLRNLPEDLYFAKAPRVDRCMTCHLAIDRKGFEDAPEPFRTHPRLDLFLGASSPHPLEKIGCTVCHGGMGPAVSFNGCAHVPDNAAEAARWRKEYHWTCPRDAQSAMLPLKYAEASCLKCHGTQEQVDFAPVLDRGRYLMVTRGCVGCHRVKDLEGLPKAGPTLIRIAGKLKKSFVEKWVWSPTSFDPAARMPSFFLQSNNSDPGSVAGNKAELDAMVDYLFAHSKGYRSGPPAPPGDAAAGRKLFRSVGCLACHGIDDVASYHADFAPDLSCVGSKLTASFVYHWIKDPQHFDPGSRMPSLRLSDREAANITAYLMTKRNKAFEKEPVPSFNPSVRDGLILDYLKPQMGAAAAKARLASMDDKARQMFLGQRSIQKYGCFGCHVIQGFEGAQGIGSDLSDWGSKQVDQLDFGFTDPSRVPRTRVGFLAAKLEDPRQFDKDKVTAFGDELKMPAYHFSGADRDAVMTAVLGLTDSGVPDAMRAGIHGDGPLLEKGLRVIADFNCKGCHLIDGQGGRIREFYNNEGIDLSMAPPDLRHEGAKVQVDWLHNFLLHVHPVRPWLHIRMPSFPWTDEQLDDVITYFNLKDHQVYPFEKVAAPRLKGRDLQQAAALFAKLQCQKCHVLGAWIPPDLGSAAPDLLKVHERLKPGWVLQWLTDPDALQPGTRMPGFWPQGVSPAPGYFGGDSKRQIEALRDYLFMMGKRP